MRAAEARARADEINAIEPKAMMLRIADDYEKVADWAEKNSVPWWDKKLADKAVPSD
jgi:Na+/phosphate symporter